MTSPGRMLRLLRMVAWFALTLPLMPVQAVLVLFGCKRLSARLPRFYHGMVCRILGIEIDRRGAPAASGPTLFVANHASYLDIEILGASIPGFFVSKSDVASWPLFGWLAKLQRTVFIDRKVRSVSRQRDAIEQRLAEGDNLILFPEGTSGDGLRLLPFKSSLFAAVEEAALRHDVAVQPVSVAYTRLDGMPLGRFYRPLFAWYGDMELAPHLWTVLGLGRLTAVVTFHPPVRARDFASRKELAEHCRRIVAAGLEAALSGRAAETSMPPHVTAPAAELAAQ
ncbi:MAG TPA: lysophospholipid acyltransferase family protein [Stellaceae bacterium]|nr:lysophospholipid acyltransferase family protein [Stellaceae bacterium]